MGGFDPRADPTPDSRTQIFSSSDFQRVERGSVVMAGEIWEIRGVNKIWENYADGQGICLLRGKNASANRASLRLILF